MLHLYCSLRQLGGRTACVMNKTIINNNFPIMRTRKLLLCLLTLLSCMAARAYDVGYEKLVYNITNATNDETKDVEVTYVENGAGNADFYKGDIEIPARFLKDGVIYNVTGIGDYAFQGCSGLTGIKIPTSVTTIGTGVFTGCSNLKYVFMTASPVPTLGENAISSENVNIIVPAEVFDDYQAAENWSMYADHIYSSTAYPVVVGQLRYQADFEKDEAIVLGKVDGETLPETLVIPAAITDDATGHLFHVTTIGGAAFENCKDFTAVSLPEGLAIISGHAFHQTNLESVQLPTTLIEVGEQAFSSCSSLKSVDFNGCSATVRRAAFAFSGLESITVPATVKLRGWTMFGWCRELKTAVIESSDWEPIGEIFTLCDKLENAVLPSVKMMSGLTFRWCASLKSVTYRSDTPDTGVHFSVNFDEGTHKDVLFTIPEGTAEAYLKAGYTNLSDLSGLPFVRSEFEAEAICIATMADGLSDGDKEALTAAIEYARTTINAAEDYATAFQQIDVIKTAACTFLTTATVPAGFEVTAAAITNPDFDQSPLGWCLPNGYDTKGWDEGKVENGETVIDKFIRAWNGTQLTVSDISQTTANLPAGIYRLEADIIAQNKGELATGVSLFAGSKQISVATTDGKPEHFSLKFEKTTTGDITIGLHVANANATWVAMDNVRLFYDGAVAPLPASQFVSGETVYMYNVETGQYLSAGHSYGTHAILDNVGLPVTLTQDEETGLWRVFFEEGSYHQQLLFHYIDGNETSEAWVDYNEQANGNIWWTITEAGDGSFLIQSQALSGADSYFGNDPTRKDYKEPNGSYTGNTYTDVIPRATADKNIHWLFFTKESSNLLATKHRLMSTILLMEADETASNEQLLTEAKGVYASDDATLSEVIGITTLLNSQMGMPQQNQPIDMTALIINPRFENNTTEGWSGATVVGGRSDATSNQEQEFYQKNFNMYQTLTGVPNGHYRLKWKGFHRPGVSSDVAADYAAGTDNASAVVYAGTVEKTMKNIASETSETPLASNEAKTGDRYFPATMEGARTYFDAGFYADELEVDVTDNTLTIGVKSTQDMGEAHWVVFSDFELYIIENADQAGNKLVQSSCNGLSGGRATLPINMSNQEAIAGFQCRVRLPEGVKAATSDNGSVRITGTSRCKDMTVSASNRGEYIQVLGYGIGKSVAAGTGAIARLELEIDGTMEKCDYQVEIYDVVLSKTNALRIKPFDTTAQLTLVDAEAGDANRDGEIDVADIITLANSILGETPKNFDEVAADMNGDGDIDVSDLISIANIILGGSNAVKTAVPMPQ